MLNAFQQTAQGFDVRRNNCSGSLKITRLVVALVDGNCAADPLPAQYRYYDNAQLDLGVFFFPMLHQILGSPFDAVPAGSDRARLLISTTAVSIAAMYRARITMNPALFPSRWPLPSGHTGTSSNPLASTLTFCSIETYVDANSTLFKTGPTLRPETSLNVAIVILPVLTVLAFLGPYVLHFVSSDRGVGEKRHLFLPRGFGLVAILAGVD